MNKQDCIGYHLENNLYSMVNFKTGEVLDTMEEVAILFDGDILMKHGHPEQIQKSYQSLNQLNQIKSVGFNKIDFNIHVVQGKFSIDELNKTLTITGYKPGQVITNATN